MGEADGILSSPRAAIERMFQQATGMTLEEFNSNRERIDAHDRDAKDLELAHAFMHRTPAYYPTMRNGEKIANWLRTAGLDHTMENLSAPRACGLSD